MNKFRFAQLSCICCLLLVSVLFIQFQYSSHSQNKKPNIFTTNSQNSEIVESVPIKLNSKSARNLLDDENQQLAKIAYFILMSKNEREKVVNLFKKINNPRNIYVLHMDKKMSIGEVQDVTKDIQQLNETYHNFYLMQQFQASYLGITLVDIEISSMAYALSVSKDWTHYIIISPSDYPLLTQEQMQQILGQVPPRISFLEGEIMSCKFVHRRIDKFYFDSAIVGRGDNHHSFTGYHFPNPQKFKIFKGSQWKLLSREMVEYIVLSGDGLGRRMLLFFAGSFIPNEHYFHTVACNSPIMNDTVRFAQVSYKNWQHINWRARSNMGKLGPNNMDADILEEALNKGTFFARKFQSDEYSQILKQSIDDLHEGFELDLMNSSFTKETVFENAKDYYFSALNGATCEDLINNDQQQPCPIQLKLQFTI